MVSFFKIFGLLFAVLLIAFLLGPRPDTDQSITFEPGMIGTDPDAYLASTEAEIDDIRPGKQKEIVWRDPVSKRKTEVALVYIHGFSATRVETDPVTMNVAAEIDANVFFTRLAGHGRDGAGLAEPRMSDWLDDIAEAVTIGERIGDQVILVAASTGGTLATWAAAQDAFAGRIAGLVLISPNYGIQGASTGLINMPWAETILPVLLGHERSFEPVNDGHADGWTHRYPSKAIFPMAALLRVVEEIDKSTITTPALFIYSSKDTVVVPSMTERVIENWGGPSEVMMVENSDDANHHVIAGDILSPGTTQVVTDKIVDWLRAM